MIDRFQKDNYWTGSETHCEMTRVPDGDWVRYEDHADLLAKATALLARAHQFGLPHPAIRRDIGAFLSRAPAYHAALTLPPDGEPGRIGGRDVPRPALTDYDGSYGYKCAQPAAPEPSACEERIAAAYRDRDYCAREADKAQQRAESAEATLAAVREEFTRLRDQARRDYRAIMGRDVAPAESARKLEAMRIWEHALTEVTDAGPGQEQKT
jgi:hypothetical protein